MSTRLASVVMEGYLEEEPLLIDLLRMRSDVVLRGDVWLFSDVLLVLSKLVVVPSDFFWVLIELVVVLPVGGVEELISSGYGVLFGEVF
jgi:hypothetical protein